MGDVTVLGGWMRNPDRPGSGVVAWTSSTHLSHECAVVTGIPADRLRAILDAVGDAAADEVRAALAALRIAERAAEIRITNRRAWAFRAVSHLLVVRADGDSAAAAVLALAAAIEEADRA